MRFIRHTFALYFTGIISCVWLTLWLFIVYDVPSEHPWISEKEKKYIQNSLMTSLTNKKVSVVKATEWSAVFRLRLKENLNSKSLER